jgi:hypothetical protein
MKLYRVLTFPKALDELQELLLFQLQSLGRREVGVLGSRWPK